MCIVSLVSCTAKKGSDKKPAKYLYASPWFQKARAWAESLSDEWFILSAKHYLLHPDTVIDPYEYSIDDYLKDRPDLTAWVNMVMFELLDNLGLQGANSNTEARAYATQGIVIVIMAGERYRLHLTPRLESLGFLVYHPTPGMGIGQQMAFYQDTTPDSIKPALEALLAEHKGVGRVPESSRYSRQRRTHSPLTGAVTRARRDSENPQDNHDQG